MCSSHVDVVAVHGFPLDWNHWTIHEWPDKLAEIRAVTELPRLGLRSRRLHVWRRRGPGVRTAADGRTADGQSSGSTGTACTIFRAPGRPRRGTARPKARPTIATSTWGFCARMARRNSRASIFTSTRPSWVSASGFISRTTGSTTPLRRLQDLGVKYHPDRIQLGRLLPAECARLVRPADESAGAVRCYGHVLLHARAQRHSAASHVASERRE